MLPRIVTHLNIDLDAAASSWFVCRFVPGYEDATVVFVPANWDGHNTKEGDFIVDLNAGGKGLKGRKLEDGKTHSCFAALVAERASPEQQQALNPLVAFIDTQDTFGNALRVLVPGIDDTPAFDVLQFTGINAVLRAIQATNPKNDSVVLAKMWEIFDGLLKNRLDRLLAELEADAAEIFPGGKVALKTQAKHGGTDHILFDRGVKVIVFVDGNNLGIWRGDGVTFRVDHPDLLAVVAEYDELAEWFAHPDGFLFCRGSRKAPRDTPSKVDPRRLAEVVARLLG